MAYIDPPNSDVVTYESITNTTLTESIVPIICPLSGQTPQYSFINTVDNDVFGNPTTWNVGSTNTVSLSTNHIYSYIAMARCYTSTATISNPIVSVKKTINYQLTTSPVNIANGATVNIGNANDFLSPFLYTMAIVSALAIYYLAYKLILYPFIRKRLK